MQAIAQYSDKLSDPLVEQHFDRSAALYVDHGLEVYRQSVEQRLDLLLRCERFTGDDAIAVLDVGCGGGAFLDQLLSRFKNAQATGVDISLQMLGSNKLAPRKSLRQADALALPDDLGEFDVICVDTVMHHLISRKGYDRTREKILQFLKSLHGFLKPGGTIVIREIYHEFRAFASLGSRVIYSLTTLPVPRKVEVLMHGIGLQTANVGVCFQTRAQWQQLFSDAGFRIAAMEDRAWPGQPYRKLGFARSGDLHFVLTRARPQL